MMKKENRKFEIKLWIKDNQTQEIIGLEKITDIEIEGGEGEKKIDFEKDSKIYQILVKVLLKKYLLGIREQVKDWNFFTPLNAPYEIYKGYMDEPNNSPEKDRERKEAVELINQWRIGRIALFLLIIIAILVLLLIYNKKRKIIRKKRRNLKNSP